MSSFSTKVSEHTRPAARVPDVKVGHSRPLEYNDEGSKEWSLARKKGIGGSDSATILGMRPYGSSRLGLWEQKTGRAENKIAGEALRFGHLIEPHIRTWLSQRARDTPAIYGAFDGLIDYPGQMRHPARDWQRGNVDGLIVRGGSVEAMVEIKSSSISHGDKGLDWVDGVMVYHMAQIQHYLEVTGLDVCHYVYFEIPAPRDFCWDLAKEFVADDRTEEFWLWFIDQGKISIETVHRDKEYGEMLTKAEAEFWQCVEDDVKPKELLTDGEIRLADQQLADALNEYGEVHATIKAKAKAPADLEDRKDELKEAIKARAQILSAANGGAKKILVGDGDDYVLWNKRGYWVAKPAARKPKSDKFEVPF